MANDNPMRPPHWLGAVAKRFFTRTLKQYPHIQDKDGLAMMAAEYDTWRDLQLELEQYINQNKTWLLDGRIHPALAASKQAHQAYERIGKRLGIHQSTNAQEVPDLSLDLDEEEGDE